MFYFLEFTSLFCCFIAMYCLTLKCFRTYLHKNDLGKHFCSNDCIDMKKQQQPTFAVNVLNSLQFLRQEELQNRK